MKKLVSASIIRLFSILILILIGHSYSQIDSMIVRDVKGNLSESPLQITLSWEAQPEGVDIDIYRRPLGRVGGDSWNLISTVTSPENSYTDTDIQEGTAYEYKIHRKGFQVSIKGYSREADGYWVSGLRVPLMENRGKILLVVDSTQSSPLQNELEQLEMDLVGDGWQVIRHDFPRHKTGTAEGLRTWIAEQYQADKEATKAVFLFGRLPIIKSGSAAPDGHNPVSHATDQYYSDVNGNWTDSDGDGVLDQNNVPLTGSDTVATELQIGRVDLAAMNAWSREETTLLKDYLIKNHNYRHGITSVPRKTLWDKVAYDRTPFESHAARSFVGEENSVKGDFKDSGQVSPYIWGIDFSDWNGSNYPDYSFKMIFALNFGSHKQKWDNANNPMRAVLCMPDYGLSCFWGVRPNWFIHHMGMGHTIGYSQWRSVNNGRDDYTPNNDYGHNWSYAVWVNLMGDPTLRMYPVLPPLQISSGSEGQDIILSWESSPDTEVIGYHLYRSQERLGPYVRCNDHLIEQTSYQDKNVAWGEYYYMCRAVKEEKSQMGSYYNASQGIFSVINHSPSTSITRKVNKTAHLKISQNRLSLEFYMKANENTRIRVYNMRGVCVYEQNQAPTKDDEIIRFSSGVLPSGLYIAEMKSANHTFRKKINLY